MEKKKRARQLETRNAQTLIAGIQDVLARNVTKTATATVHANAKESASVRKAPVAVEVDRLVPSRQKSARMRNARTKDVIAKSAMRTVLVTAHVDAKESASARKAPDAAVLA